MIALRECALPGCSVRFQSEYQKGRHKLYCSTKCNSRMSELRRKMRVLYMNGLSREEVRLKLGMSFKDFMKIDTGINTYFRPNRKLGLFFSGMDSEVILDEDYLLTHRAKYPPMNYALPTQESETVGEFYNRMK